MIRRKGLFLSLCLAVAPCAHAQRLSDFLQVKGWDLKLNVSGAASGSHSGPMGSDRWTASVNGTANGKLDQLVVLGQYWTGTLTGSLTYDYKMVSQLPSGCTQTTTIKGSGPLEKLAGVDFMFMLGPGEKYQFFLGKGMIPLTNTQTLECPGSAPVTMANTVTDTAWPFFGRGYTEDQPFPSSGLLLKGTLKSEWFYPTAGGNSWLLSGDTPPLVTAETTYELSPLAATELLLEVESPDYNTWRPSAEKDGSAGKSIQLKATLRNKDNSPVNQHAVKFTWELAETSREPGIAMNWPASNPQKTPDMKFVPAAGQAITDGQDRQRMERISPEGLSDTAIVEPFDWGGWTTVKVTAELQDGKKVTGELKEPNGDKVIRLPKRKPGSLIADVWKEKPGRDGADNSDEENHQGGDSRYKGDGLTLYEEYRGFYINGERGNEDEQADPRKKDLFVLNLAGADVDQAGKILEKQLGIRVHTNLLRAELGDERVINRHYDSGAHKVDQHGLIVKVVGEAYAEAVSAAGRPGPPGTVMYIRLPVSFPSRRSGGYSYGALTIAHEFLHAMAVYHHGDADDKEVAWTPDGNGHFLENGSVTVDLRLEDESAYPPRATPGLIGVKGGPHCGDGYCLMRYDIANAYVANGNPSLRYVVSELPGTHVCESAKGDGVNSPDWQPQSRYGDAASNRGNCRAQVIVSDYYNAPVR